MSSVGVADGAQCLVVATDKRWTRANSRRRPADGQVQLEAEFHHRIRLVDLRIGEALATQFVEGLPGRLDDGVVLFLASGYVQQPEDNTGRVGTQKAAHVAAYSLALDQAGNIGAR